jgi:outer membrane protein TolC
MSPSGDFCHFKIQLLSCAVGPNYRTPALPSPAHWRSLEGAAHPLTHGGKAGDLSQWWHRLKDPQLSALVKQALVASPNLRLAQARLREARARRIIAGAAQWPSVSASGSVSRKQSTSNMDNGGRGTQFSASFDASWELDLFGAVRRGIEAARADQESAEASINDARVENIGQPNELFAKF